MKWRLALDLPARLGLHVPPLVNQMVIAVVCAAAAWTAYTVMAALVYAATPPLVVVLPAIIVATLLGGMPSGLMTLAACQLMIWLMVMPAPSYLLENGGLELWNIVVITLAHLVIILIASSFRKAAQRLIDFERERSETLLLAMREMDHRTKNNFQIACSVLRLQASRSGNPVVADALNQAANRILSIAATHDNLSDSSTDFQAINVNLYLSNLCSRIIGAVDRGIVLNHDLEDCELDRDKALSLGLIINELITNAVKHAFAGGAGRLDLNGRITAHGYRVMFGDNGPGAEEEAPPGLGRRLIELLASKAAITIDRVAQNGHSGTVYRIVVPIARKAVSGPAARPTTRAADQKLVLTPTPDG